MSSGNISEKPMRYEAHHAPHSSQAMKYYLDEDPSNIVAVHCLAGKLHSLVCHGAGPDWVLIFGFAAVHSQAEGGQEQSSAPFCCTSNSTTTRPKPFATLPTRDLPRVRCCSLAPAPPMEWSLTCLGPVLDRARRGSDYSLAAPLRRLLQRDPPRFAWIDAFLASFRKNCVITVSIA